MLWCCCLALCLTPAGPQVTASEVKFPAAEMTLRQAIDWLNQTGNRVLDARGRQGVELTNPVLRLPTQPLRFWEAVDLVAKQGNMRADSFTERDGQAAVALLLPAGGADNPSATAHYEGPFRYRLAQSTRFEAAVTPGTPRLHVSIEVAWEPRYRPLWLHVPAQGVQVKDATGKWQTVTVVPQSHNIADQASVLLTVPVPVPPGGQEKLPQIRLQTMVVIPPRQTPFQFSHVTAGQTVEMDGASCTLVAVDEEQAKKRAWVSLRLTYPEQALDLESHQAWVMQANALVLIPKNGGQPLRFSTAQAEINIRERAGIELRHRLDNLPEALTNYHLRYEAPAPPVRYPLTMQMTEISLPPGR